MYLLYHSFPPRFSFYKLYIIIFLFAIAYLFNIYFIFRMIVRVFTSTSLILNLCAVCYIAGVTQEVTISEETPLSFGSSDLQIGRSKFTSYHEDAVVKYYPMIFKDKFRKVYENMTAKLLNSYANDALDLAIDTEGRKLLSTAEDEFKASLKWQYSVESNNSISIFVNGIPLSEWGPENKVIK